MSRPRKKRALVPILLGSLIAIAAGVWLTWNKPHPKAEDQQGERVTAAALYEAFSRKAATAYDGKVVEVNGSVGTVTVNQDGKTVAELATSDPMGVVQCTFREQVTVQQGAAATVKGFCNGFTEMDGMGGTVVLNDCVLVP